MCSSTPGANDWIVCEATTAADVSVNTSNVVISTTGTSDYGVSLSNTYGSWAQGESANVSIVMTGGSITTTGRAARGVFAWMQDSDGVGDVTIDLTRVAISATGRSAVGVRSTHSGTGAQVIRMTGGSVESGNAGVHAYRARGGTQTIELSGGVTVSTTGGSAYGVYAQRAGTGDGAQTIRMTGGSVGTQGEFAHGVRVRATSAGSEVPITVELSGVDVSTMGDSADGVRSWSLADGAHDVDVTGGSITTTGALATGLYAHHQGDTGKLTIDVSGGTVIETSGYSGVHGNESTSDGTAITLSEVSIETRGSSQAVGSNTIIAAVYGQRVGRRADDDTKGDLVIDLTEATLTATPTALYGRGVLRQGRGARRHPRELRERPHPDGRRETARGWRHCRAPPSPRRAGRSRTTATGRTTPGEAPSPSRSVRRPGSRRRSRSAFSGIAGQPQGRDGAHRHRARGGDDRGPGHRDSSPGRRAGAAPPSATDTRPRPTTRPGPNP